MKPLFPFGYGLSYTTFEYDKPTLSANTITDGGRITVRVPVKNTGDRKGKEIVQLYIADEKCSVDRPAKELKGFSKLSLEPGEVQTATFGIDVRDLMFYDEATHAWKAEPGRFKIIIGASVEDVRGTATFEYVKK